MNSIYYNSSRAEILKRLYYLNSKRYVDFFRDLVPFKLAISLAYFGFATDELIDTDKYNQNITTRFVKYIDDSYLRDLFLGSIKVDVIRKKLMEIQWSGF